MDDTVEGLNLEQYSKLAVALNGVPEAEWDAVAAKFGVGPGKVVSMGAAWQQKMTGNPQLAIEYNAHYQQAMIEAGITAPEVTLEQYAELVKTGPDQATLDKYGIDLQQFSMISQRMGERMMADMGLAQQFAQLMMPQS